MFSACESGWWPSDDKQTCLPLKQQYMRWDSLYALVPVSLSIMGIFLTSAVMCLFVININTPVVKASGRELSFMLFGGFLLCYAMTFPLLAKPSPVVCTIQRFGVGISFSVTYSSLLVKTNRIARIFDSARHSAQCPPFISPKSQVCFTLLLILIQVTGAVVWLILEPPDIRLYHPFGRRNEIVLRCGFGDHWFMASLGYNIILIIVCTVYAVKTRKIPENFNESKYIGFAMYTTCIVWLAFVPIYFGTYNSFQVQVSTLCISISLSSTVALLCLFLPKLHIIAFQAEKNLRRPTLNSGAYKKSMSRDSSTLSAEFSRQGILPTIGVADLCRTGRISGKGNVRECKSDQITGLTPIDEKRYVETDAIDTNDTGLVDYSSHSSLHSPESPYFRVQIKCSPEHKKCTSSSLQNNSLNIRNLKECSPPQKSNTVNSFDDYDNINADAIIFV